MPGNRPPISSPTLLLALAASVLGSAACGEVREPTPGREAPAATYVRQVRPILQTRCISCHSGATPAGSYDLSTYLTVMGHGSDTTRNVLPGDKTSLLLTNLDAAKSAKHYGYLAPPAEQLKAGETAADRQKADLALISLWVVEGKATYQDSSVHPAGWLTPSDRSAKTFHGGYLRKKQWQTTECQSCHGTALTGGAADETLSGGSCYTCHSGGPTSCDTCHGDGKAGKRFAGLSGAVATTNTAVGAHAAHLKAASTSGQWLMPTCADCHKVPKTVDEAGHLGSDLFAEITFSDRASGKLYAGGKGPAAAYDQTTGTCTNVHCHGLDGGAVKEWKWTASQTMACDSCHGMPPKKAKAGWDHPDSTDCKSCHSSAYDPSKHIDGKVDL